MKTINYLTLVGILFLAFISCQKSELVTEDNNLLVDQEEITEKIMLELDLIGEEAIDFQFNFLKSAGGRGVFIGDNCPAITYEMKGSPKIITLDFGTGCTGRDGKTRSGKIVIKSSSFENMKATREKTFENFMVENRKIEGSVKKTVTVDRENFSRLTEVDEDITITFADGSKAVRKANLNREHNLGVLLDRTDDHLVTWGEIETTRPKGVKVTKLISEDNPLVFMASCRQIVSGIATFSTSEGNTWSIDYGQGECDGEATITRNGETKTIKLK
jgi:hypothetical protein